MVEYITHGRIIPILLLKGKSKLILWQNVTDAASSKAFMQLAARFPPGRRFAAAAQRAQQASAACKSGAACIPGTTCPAAEAQPVPVSCHAPPVSIPTLVGASHVAPQDMARAFDAGTRSAGSKTTLSAAVQSPHPAAPSPVLNPARIRIDLISPGGRHGALRKHAAD